MFIESIELSDYRNYSHLHIDFHKGTNVLYGDNAQGKTNILEQSMCAAQQNRIGAAKIKKLSGSARTNPTSNDGPAGWNSLPDRYASEEK